MYRALYDKKFLKKRHLITNGYCLPYNPNLVARANELRKNMTPMARKLWVELFKDFPLKVMRQKPIDNYIVDFYCSKLRLVLEIDGSVHDTREAEEYDSQRTGILENYNLKVIRFRNEEIEKEFDKVRAIITDELKVYQYSHGETEYFKTTPLP
jgi:very-short-patch-repair endonuclease